MQRKKNRTHWEGSGKSDTGKRNENRNDKKCREANRSKEMMLLYTWLHTETQSNGNDNIVAIFTSIPTHACAHTHTHTSVALFTFGHTLAVHRKKMHEPSCFWGGFFLAWALFFLLLIAFSSLSSSYAIEYQPWIMANLLQFKHEQLLCLLKHEIRRIEMLGNQVCTHCNVMSRALANTRARTQRHQMKQLQRNRLNVGSASSHGSVIGYRNH